MSTVTLLDLTRRSNLGCPPRRPTRAAVEEIVSRVAGNCDCTPADVLGASSKHWRARMHAIVRIVVETRCSINGLAEVSGWSRRTIQFALAEFAGRGRARRAA